MSSPDQTGSRSPDPDPARGIADAAGVQAARGEAPAGRATAFERGSAEAVLVGWWAHWRESRAFAQPAEGIR